MTTTPRAGHPDRTRNQRHILSGRAKLGKPALRHLTPGTRHAIVPGMIRPTTSLAGSLDQVLVVVTPAALDHTGADPVRQAVVDLLPDRDDAAVVLDCTACELITSIGIAALLEIREFCSERGVPLRVAALADEPRSILRMLRLDGKFTYDATLEEAIAAVE